MSDLEDYSSELSKICKAGALVGYDFDPSQALTIWKWHSERRGARWLRTSEDLNYLGSIVVEFFKAL